MRFSHEFEPVRASENWAKPERRFQTILVRRTSDMFGCLKTKIGFLFQVYDSRLLIVLSQ